MTGCIGGGGEGRGKRGGNGDGGGVVGGIGDGGGGSDGGANGEGGGTRGGIGGDGGIGGGGSHREASPAKRRLRPSVALVSGMAGAHSYVMPPACCQAASKVRLPRRGVKHLDCQHEKCRRIAVQSRPAQNSRASARLRNAHSRRPIQSPTPTS